MDVDVDVDVYVDVDVDVVYRYMYVYMYPLAFGSPRHRALSRFQSSELYRKRIAGEYRLALPFGALPRELFSIRDSPPASRQPATSQMQCKEV